MPSDKNPKATSMLNKFIHVDKRNGCIEIEREQAESSIVFCDTHEYARDLILGLGADRWQATLEVSPQIYNALNKEFSIKTF